MQIQEEAQYSVSRCHQRSQGRLETKIQRDESMRECKYESSSRRIFSESDEETFARITSVIKGLKTTSRNTTVNESSRVYSDSRSRAYTIWKLTSVHETDLCTSNIHHHNAQHLRLFSGSQRHRWRAPHRVRLD